MLRRSLGPSADGRLLGEREPDRTARGLRRSEALRGSDDDGVSPLPRDRHEDRPDLQHLRPADAIARWASGAGVHRPGVERNPAHDFWGWLPDALVLLRVGFDRRDFP